MRTVNSFRFTADVTGGAQPVHIAGEFSSPDRVHETVAVGTSTLELVQIGSRTFRRDTPTSPWSAVTPTGSSAPTDPRIAFGILASADSVSAAGSTYTFTLTNAVAAKLVTGSSSVTGTATVAGGHITDLAYQSKSPSISVHLVYSAINATPAVTAPPT
jgi:hypothetical protein